MEAQMQGETSSALANFSIVLYFFKIYMFSNHKNPISQIFLNFHQISNDKNTQKSITPCNICMKITKHP